MKTPTTIEEARPVHENKLSIVKEGKLGKLRVTKEFVECARGDAWDILMRNMRVLEASFDIYTETITYTGYSEWFDPSDGVHAVYPPLYEVRFSRDEKTGEIKIDTVCKVETIAERVTDDNVFERIKRTIRESNR